MSNTFSPDDTSCNDCIFYNDQWPYSHTACKLNKLEKYESNLIKISYNANNDFRNTQLTLKSFQCPYFRPTSWAEKIIKEENAIPYFIIYFINNKPLSEIQYDLEIIENFDRKPKSVIFIKNIDSNRISTTEIVSMLTNRNTKYQWQVRDGITKEAWHTIYNSYNKHEFMLLYYSTPNVPKNWLSLIENKIQEDLLKFAYAADFNENIMLISPFVYNSMYYSFGKEWIKKLQDTTPCNLKYNLSTIT